MCENFWTLPLLWDGTGLVLVAKRLE